MRENGLNVRISCHFIIFLMLKVTAIPTKINMAFQIKIRESSEFPNVNGPHLQGKL
jgi:hypothetical protein